MERALNHKAQDVLRNSKRKWSTNCLPTAFTVPLHDDNIQSGVERRNLVSGWLIFQMFSNLGFPKRRGTANAVAHCHQLLTSCTITQSLLTFKDLSANMSNKSPPSLQAYFESRLGATRKLAQEDNDAYAEAIAKRLKVSTFYFFRAPSTPLHFETLLHNICRRDS